jgi:cytochrome c oxidase subunit III
MSTAEATAEAHAHADHAHAHPPFLQHHYDTPQHQFDAGKMGIWLFLVTEVLFFSGLFCAYAVYRSLHPEVFIYAHYFLDTTLGAVNTAVLIFSSLTMAWAVRCAQTNNKNGTVVLLLITILCAFIFMGIKYVEYKGKWEHGLLFGKNYKSETYERPEGGGLQLVKKKDAKDEHAKPDEHGAPAAQGDAHGGDHHGPPPHVVEPRNVNIFFAIYFCMTGLHAFHILGGIAVLAWITVRAARGDFSDQYFGPVDYVGLYWHLVDLIWIYLFPLLYLMR